MHRSLATTVLLLGVLTTSSAPSLAQQIRPQGSLSPQPGGVVVVSAITGGSIFLEPGSWRLFVSTRDWFYGSDKHRSNYLGDRAKPRKESLLLPEAYFGRLLYRTPESEWLPFENGRILDAGLEGMVIEFRMNDSNHSDNRGHQVVSVSRVADPWSPTPAPAPGVAPLPPTAPGPVPGRDVLGVWMDLEIEEPPFRNRRAVDLRGKLGLQFVSRDALQVSYVFDNSPAERAGFRIGDRLFSLGGNRVGSEEAVARVRDGLSLGQHVPASVIRRGRMVALSIPWGLPPLGETGPDGSGEVHSLAEALARQREENRALRARIDRLSEESAQLRDELSQLTAHLRSSAPARTSRPGSPEPRDGHEVRDR